MTTTAATERNALIEAWRLSSKRTEQVAADLATRIVSGRYPAWSELETLAALARMFDTSERTVSAAKRVLCGHGFLVLQERRYYVA